MVSERAKGIKSQTAEVGIKNYRKIIVAILLIAFFVRLGWILAVPTQPISDFKEFDRLATSLVSGKGYTALTGQPTAYRPPGYIFFLAGVYAIFGHDILIARLSNAILGVLTCWLTFLLAVELFNRRTAIIAASLMAIFPSLIAWANILATENLFIPMLLGIIITFINAAKGEHIRWPWLILCGLLCGISVLIRPTALLLPGTMVIALIIITGIKNMVRQGINSLAKPAVITISLYLLVGIIILPWTIRNERVFGHFVLISTEGGITFLAGHNEGSLSAEYSLEGPVFNTLNAENLDEISYDQHAYQLAFQFIREHPELEARLLFHKLFNFFKDDVSGFTYNEQSALTPLPHWLVVATKGSAEIFYLSVLALAVASVFLKGGDQDRWYLILIVIIIGWTVFHLAYYGKDRFRLPLAPALAMLAATTILAAWEKRSTWFHRKRDSL